MDFLKPIVTELHREVYRNIASKESNSPDEHLYIIDDNSSFYIIDDNSNLKIVEAA